MWVIKDYIFFVIIVSAFIVLNIRFLQMISRSKKGKEKLIVNTDFPQTAAALFFLYSIIAIVLLKLFIDGSIVEGVMRHIMSSSGSAVLIYLFLSVLFKALNYVGIIKATNLILKLYLMPICTITSIIYFYLLMNNKIF